jgi:hypothetical protein
MKKSIIFIFLGLLLLTTFCLAEENNETTNLEEQAEKPQLPSIKNLTQNFTAPQKLNEILLKEREFPKKLEKIETSSRFLFGIEKEDNPNLHFLAILIAFILFTFLLAYQLIKLVPSFSGSTYWIGAIVPTFLLSVSKTLNFLTEKVIQLFGKIAFLENFKIIEIIFIVLILTLVLNYLSLLIRKVKNKNDLEKARESGERIGRQFAKMEVMDMFDEYKLNK